MSLDLGTLQGHVDLDTAKFERKYGDVTQLVKRLASATIPDLEVDADIRDATTNITKVEAALKKVASAEVVAEVDAAIEDAKANIARIEAELDAVDAVDAEATVDADVSPARQSLDRAKAELRALEGARAEVVVDADTSGATEALGDVEAEATDAGGRAGKGAGSNLSAGIIAALATIPIAGAVVGIGVAIGKALLDGLQNEVREDRFMAQTGLDAATASRFGRAAGEAYAGNFGESIAANLDTARAAIQAGLLDPNATKIEAQQVIESISGVADLLGEDIPRVARSAAQAIKTGIAQDAAGAFDLLVKGQQAGLNVSEDWLDTIDEYGTQFRELGLDGPKAMGLLSQAVKAGARDTDVAADALKELAIRAKDGTAAAADGFSAIGVSGKEMQAAIAEGGPAAADMLERLLTGLRNIDDPAARSAAALALFGSKAEDLQGAAFGMDLSTAVEQLGQVEGAARSALETLGDNSAGKIASAQRNIEVAADGIKGALATAFSPQIEGFATFVSTNREAVLTFLLDAANGALDFGRTLVEAAASGTEGIGSFLAGPVADMIDALANVAVAIDRATPGDQGSKGFREWADGAIDGLKDTEETLDGVADTMRTNLIENVLDPAQAKLNELAIPMIAEAALNDATGRLATGVETLGFKADGSKLALSELNGAVDLSTLAGQELDGQIRSVVGALDAQLVAAAGAGESQEQLRGRVDSARDAFINQMTALGLTKDAATKLADQYGLIPDRVNTVVTADTSQAQTALDRFLTAARNQSVTIQARVNADPSYTPAVSQNSIARSAGGWIPGVPSPVDSVHVFAAPGEFVVNTAAAQKNPELLEAINDDKLGDFLGDGGLVGAAPSMGALMSAGPSVNVNPVINLAGAQITAVFDGIGPLTGYIRDVSTRTAERTAKRDIRTSQARRAG
ncbi:phage tail tape measure protein [Oerskovia enterophila]|uniref:Phage-related minor tail protein n=1 Tax=Oerskovia enterophila TaxID=43678 RepID=A0A163QUI6_9CELL|nr:phage tail tape measure protein [Oerskovia enterophila]KZM34549.1 phage-related minor tail protein [Oerskovia enterophila]